MYIKNIFKQSLCAKFNNKLAKSLSALLFISASTAYAIDVDPGDYTALPEGSKLGLIYYKSVKRNSLYNDKRKVSSNSKLNTQVSILRAVRYQEFAGYLTNIQILLPMARFSAAGDISALENTKGVGDPIIASTVFLKADTAATHSFGIAQYLTVPVGRYSHKRDLNVGENRWKYTLQFGYVGSLTESILYDLTGDVTFFGDNNKYTENKLTMKQKPKYQLQGYLRYKLTDRSEIYTGYSRDFKGETKVDGRWQNDVTNQSKFMLGASYFLSSNTQVLGTLGADLSVDNGFKEKNSVSIRLMHLF